MMITFRTFILRWNYRKPIAAAQRYIDSTVLRLSDPYIPKDTGMLIRSGTLHTRIGSGQVRYVTPYAANVYYNNRGRGRNGMNSSAGGLRGRLWFLRMKADKLLQILRGAQRAAERNIR